MARQRARRPGSPPVTPPVAPPPPPPPPSPPPGTFFPPTPLSGGRPPAAPAQPAPAPPPLPPTYLLQSESEGRQGKLREQIDFASSAEGKAALQEEAVLREQLNRAERNALASPFWDGLKTAGQSLAGMASAAVGVASALGAGPFAQLGGAAVSAATGNFGGAAAAGAGAIMGIAKTASPVAAATLEDSFTLLATTVGKDLTPILLKLADVVQSVAQAYEGSLVQDAVQGTATAFGDIVEALRFNKDLIMTGSVEEANRLAEVRSQPKLSLRGQPQASEQGFESYAAKLLAAGLNQQGDLQAEIQRNIRDNTNQLLQNVQRIAANSGPNRGL